MSQVAALFILILFTVLAVAFALRKHREINNLSLLFAGSVSLISGLVTSAIMLIHVTSVQLDAMTKHEALTYDLETLTLLALGSAVFIPGVSCVRHSFALTRGEQHAQKRTLAAAVIILGLTLPLSTTDPRATLMASLSLINLILLLISPSKWSSSEGPQPASCPVI